MLSIKSKMDIDYDHILNIDYDHEFTGEFMDGNSYIISEGRDVKSLNGTWNYCEDTFDTGVRKRFFDEIYADEDGNALPKDCSFEDWDTMELPCNWNFQRPDLFHYEGTVIFTREFEYYAARGRRAFLKIGAANYETRVWVNTKLVGRHLGGYTPFALEITEQLKNGENRIYISVNNTRKMENIPSANFDWFNYGGIYRDIELISVNEKFVKNFFCHLVNDSEYNKIRTKVWVEGTADVEKCLLEIPELGIKKEILLVEGEGELTVTNTGIELWSPENPKLYNVEITYNGETLKDNIGFKQVETKGTRVYLNGKDIFFKGICVHEEEHNRGRNLTDEEMRKVLQDAKDLGCNYLRLSHYPHNEKMAKFADEMGIMLWEEIPVYWALMFENPDTMKTAENQLREMITRDYNRVSVAFWGVGNENPDTDERLHFMSSLAATARELDPTRLITAACLVNIDNLKIQDRLTDHVDIVGINEYYGWYYRNYESLEKILENSNIGKPVFVSETGAGALAGHSGEVGELFTEEHQAHVYEKQIELLGKADYVRGMSPWILYDFRSQVRLNKFQKGYNRKGLICPEKTHKKKAYYVLQNFYKNN